MRFGNDSQQYRGTSHGNCGDVRLRSAQVGQVAQTDSSVQAARADLPQTGSTDTQFKQRDQRYRLQKPFTATFDVR